MLFALAMLGVGLGDFGAASYAGHPSPGSLLVCFAGGVFVGIAATLRSG